MKIYIKPNQNIGSEGYTDLRLKKNGKLELHSIEGAELDFYDEEKDKHYPVKYDMDVKVNGKKNPNFGKLFYEME